MYQKGCSGYSADYEEGNKQMFLSLKDETETKIIDQEFSLTVPLLDAPHLGKSFKASFNNWILKLFNERGCLAFLYTLRNKSDRDETVLMKTLITKKRLCEK